MSGFHNEHLIGEYQEVCNDENCLVVGANCKICHEDVSWIINRRNSNE